MADVRSERKTKKQKKKFNRRDVMYSIINYKILIYRLLQNTDGALQTRFVIL
jgi:hypothetical protein